MTNIIKESIQDNILVHQKIVNSASIIETIERCAIMMIDTLNRGNKIHLCGNGGSASDAQHIAAELSGRFSYDRRPLNAEALHCNTSAITAIANDYGFEEIFSRMLESSGKAGDILIGLSTSGNSKNIIKAFEKANEMGIQTIALTGESGGSIQSIANHIIRIPSESTPRIQEAHIMIGHILCQIVESSIFPQR